MDQLNLKPAPYSLNSQYSKSIEERKDRADRVQGMRWDWPSGSVSKP